MKYKSLEITITVPPVLLLTLILAFFLLFYRINEIPYYQGGAWVSDIINFSTWPPPNKIGFYLFMFNTYKAAGFNYLTLIFQFFFKDILTCFKITTAFFDILTIIMIYFFVYEFFNKKVAILSSFFYTIFPSVINLSRTGLDASVLPFFVVTCLFLFYRWYKTEKRFYLYLGSFLLSFGICVYLSFVYFSLAIIITAFLMKNVRKKFSPIISRNVIIFFILGLLPYILGNLLGNFQTFNFLLDNLLITKSNQHNNLLIFQNFIETTQNFIGLSDNYFYGGIKPIIPSLSVNFLIFCAAIIYFLISKNRSKELFLILIVFIGLFLSTFSITSLIDVHVFFLLPILCIIISKFILDIFSKTNKFLASIFLIIILISNSLVLYYYFNQYTGSEFGYKALCNYLNEKDVKVVVSSGALQVITPFCYKNENVIKKENALEGLSYILENSNTQYVLEITEYNTNISDFINKNSNIILLKTIYTSDGEGLYYVYENKAI
jgi:4-amino-4-deoxy-L-arabinose transferase-like glycosyltransferase